MKPAKPNDYKLVLTGLLYLCVLFPYYENMKISISGSTGFIGRRLIAQFQSMGWNVSSILRDDFKLNDKEFSRKLEGAEVVINLAGAPIIKKWNESYKEELYNSRILTTRRIVKSIEQMNIKPKVFISNSAVGIYKSDIRCTENNAEYACDIVGKICIDWEKEALGAASFTRVVIFRIGVILDKNEGALKKMMLPFRFGLGGKIGNGNQQFSWIHITDLLNAYIFAIHNESLSGVVNISSPHTVTNKEFTKALAKQLKRPSFIPVPPILLKILYGEGAQTLIEGKYAYPERLINFGFSFEFPEIQSALGNILQE